MRRFLAVFLAGAALALPFVAVAGDLEITVDVPGGKTLTGGALFVLDRELPIPASGAKTLVQGLPDRRIAVTVDGVAKNASGKGTSRLIGVAEVETIAGKTLKVEVKIAEVSDIEAFCLGCHPTRDKKALPGQIYRDLHQSGKELTEKYLDQVKAHNKRVEELRKTKAPNPPYPIPLEERVVKVGGKNVVRQFYTCESCHTPHLKTPWGKLMRAPYEKGNDLCVGCHY